MATTPNYSINYDDKRFTDVLDDKKAAINEVDATYGDMISASDDYYQKQIDASQAWADKQTELQNQQTEHAINKIEQQKDQTKQDYLKEQSGAYTDWQKQSNQYGANAEQMAAQGMTNTGFSESSQVSMYNTYQNRVATARESYNRAVLNYDNAIKDAQLQNSSTLAEIAYQALQQQLELSLQGFQYKNQLLIEQSNKKLEVDNIYHQRYQDVLNQLNTENALKEEVRQYNQSYDLKIKEYEEGIRQFNEEIARLKAKDEQEYKLEIEQLELQKAQLEEEKRQFNQLHSKSSGGGGGGGGDDSTGGGDGAKLDPPDSPGDEEDLTIGNAYGDSWIEIPGHGRFSWAELYAYVQDGQIKEIISNGTVTYRWVDKKGSGGNVTPTATGYKAKQKDLMVQAF